MSLETYKKYLSFPGPERPMIERAKSGAVDIGSAILGYFGGRAIGGNSGLLGFGLSVAGHLSNNRALANAGTGMMISAFPKGSSSNKFPSTMDEVKDRLATAGGGVKEAMIPAGNPAAAGAPVNGAAIGNLYREAYPEGAEADPDLDYSDYTEEQAASPAVGWLDL